MQITEQSQEDTTNVTRKKSSRAKCCGIYGLRNKINNKWYVGQSIDIKNRWCKYKNLDCKSQPKLLRALIKHGIKNFEFCLFEICQDVEWILDYREIYWIKILNSICNGYNIRDGGSRGKLSEETKKKLSLAHKGKKKPKRTIQQLENMRNAQLGKKASALTKLKMKNSSLVAWEAGKRNRTFSDAHRKAISESAKARYKDPTKNPNYGKKASDLLRKKISEGVKLSSNNGHTFHEVAVI